jgi:hypothetical protein
LRKRFGEVGTLDGRAGRGLLRRRHLRNARRVRPDLLEADDVAVYDGSMSEWIADPARPLARG